MNDTLWKSIQQFDFDHPPGEYNFSIRLASENQWTKDFTEKAILEYKKFMYMAAISDVMVSPSAIVDTVWHQHLIFTQSYQVFCALVGRQIQHVPSTHQKEQAEQFRLAKERTSRIYHEHFGAQPKAIWEYDTMLAGLKLEPAKLKTGFLSYTVYWFSSCLQFLLITCLNLFISILIIPILFWVFSGWRSLPM
ncbi:glycine-rich domain-containing protein [Pedobacter kyonggii]|uniref:Uncharacterized protein n=1 Tax=Pedobacter kyonggii TaxID=1926871 RepID=A0A4Q9HCM4_9SPHI|nr:hypothetical protein [Pedobacter kyonggii]TBO42123.1 hypothetical protein EYS08_11365 [Pedobacter kyonggii]